MIKERYNKPGIRYSAAKPAAPVDPGVIFVNDRDLKRQVLEANLRLASTGLAPLTWGNVSQRDASGRCMLIKPSGVPYDTMREDDLVLVDISPTIHAANLGPIAGIEKIQHPVNSLASGNSYDVVGAAGYSVVIHGVYVTRNRAQNLEHFRP